MTKEFIELNSDQRRELVNTRQRFEALHEAETRRVGFRGSMVWEESKGREYLMRSAYKNGRRRQVSLGLRSQKTESIKSEFERGRSDAEERLKSLKQTMIRQAAVNKAIGLGRVPSLGARIIRALDKNGLLGNGIRVLGTNAIYAYEAAAGIHVGSALTATEDIDLLLDSRSKLDIIGVEEIEHSSLLHILQRIDKSFQRTEQTFRAANKEGYLVDLIKPLRTPPWSIDQDNFSANSEDLTAIEIDGLSWHESAPAFEAICIDERGEPVRIVTSDPRIFAAHKFWLSQRVDREPIKRRRDLEQAKAVAHIVSTHLPHLQFDREQLLMLPRALFDDAAPLFQMPIQE